MDKTFLSQAGTSSSSKRPKSPPPPYSASTTATNSAAMPPTRKFEREQELPKNDIKLEDGKPIFLKHFDTVFLIDDSTSMGWEGSLPDQNRWHETESVLKSIVPTCVEFDEDGVDIYFLNTINPLSETEGPSAGTGYRHVKSAQEVMDIFETRRPYGGTPLGPRLNFILGTYLDYYRKQRENNGLKHGVKPINIIIITDGVPDEQDEVTSCIIYAMKELDELRAMSSRVGIQFFQVGAAKDATTFLKYLDDELCKKATSERDMVDRATFNTVNGGRAALTHDWILKVVQGGISRRYDRIENGGY